jgi:flagellar FliL protein
MAEEDKEESTGEVEKKKSPLMLIIIIVVVLSVGGGAGAFFMMGDKEEAVAENENGEAADSETGEEVVAKSAHYFSLDPAFIVNFTGKSRARFLQVSIEGMTRDEKVKEEITKHFPQVRNNIVLLLSGKTSEQLSTPQGKDKLRKEVLKEIQDILVAETGKEGVEDVYFTSFVMQ